MNRNNIFRFSEAVPDASSYMRLFETTGWNSDYKADQNKLFQSISNSWYVISVYNEDSQLIDFGRLISDGGLYAFVCDMIIEPDYQNQGIGGAILKKLIHRCRVGRIRVLWLFSATNKASFYKKYGFEARPTHAPGMQLKLYRDD